MEEKVRQLYVQRLAAVSGPRLAPLLLTWSAASLQQQLAKAVSHGAAPGGAGRPDGGLRGLPFFPDLLHMARQARGQAGVLGGSGAPLQRALQPCTTEEQLVQTFLVQQGALTWQVMGGGGGGLGRVCVCGGGECVWGVCVRGWGGSMCVGGEGCRSVPEPMP